MPSKTIEDFAYQVRDYMRGAEVVEGKNKLEITDSNSYTEGGVTFTVNSDKSVTVDTNGVASSANARLVLQMPIKHLVNEEEYVISGTPNDIDGTKAYVGISDWVATNYDDTTGEGAEFTMFNPASYPNARIYIYVKSGTTLSNKVFKPMICTASDWNKSHTYEPYYVPVKDRVDKITNLSSTQLSAEEQEYYSISGTGYCHKMGKITEIGLQIRCLSPSSPAWADFILGLPIPINSTPVYQSVLNTNGTSCIQVGIHATGKMIVTGGVANGYYNVFFVYLNNE